MVATWRASSDSIFSAMSGGGAAPLEWWMGALVLAEAVPMNGGGKALPLAELAEDLGLPEDAPWPVVEAYCVRVLAGRQEGIPLESVTPLARKHKPRPEGRMIKSQMTKSSN